MSGNGPRLPRDFQEMVKKCHKIGKNATKWSKMVRKWSKIVQDGLKWQKKTKIVQDSKGQMVNIIEALEKIYFVQVLGRA